MDTKKKATCDWVPQPDHLTVSFVLYLKHAMTPAGQRWNFRRVKEEALTELTRRLEEEGHDCFFYRGQRPPFFIFLHTILILYLITFT